MTKILWSGLAGMTGLQAIITASKDPGLDVAITDGMTKHPRSKILQTHAELFQQVNWHPHGETERTAAEIRDRVDVIVNLTHAKVLDQLVDLALRINKPIVHCGIEKRIPDVLSSATERIPVFYSKRFPVELGNFVSEGAATFETTALYLLKIATAMTTKSPGKLYTLKDLWPDLEP